MIQKILKKSGIVLLTFLLGQLFLFGTIGNTVYAAGDSPTNTAGSKLFENQIQERQKIGDSISKIMTIGVRPLLTVAGIAMDNSMVYGSSFGFDTALWRIRNIAKNIANFMLGFLFVYYLFDIIVRGKTGDIKTKIQETLIAGILIQASRFITAAAVDLSTIATYAIGGMPLSVMGQNIENQNHYVLGTTVFIDTDKEKEGFIIIKTTEGGWKISPCVTTLVSGTGTQIVILGREYLYYEDNGQGYPTKENVCHTDGGNIYWFNENEDELLKDLHILPSDNLNDMKNKQTNGNPNYNTRIGEFKTKISTGAGVQKEYIDKGKIVLVKNQYTTSGGLTPSSGTIKVEGISGTVTANRGIDETIGANNQVLKNQKIGEAGGAATTDKLFQTSKSYVGVFSTLYSTLMDTTSFGLTNNTTTNTTYVTILNTMVNIAYIAALLLPLAALVVVLIMRVVILRAVIALSPLIVLAKVFDWEKKMSGSLEYFKLGEIIKLLLAPVLISFAVSLSTMLIIILKTGLNDREMVKIDQEILGGLFHISIQGIGADLSKLILSVIGVAIVRFLLFWAVRQSKVGEGIGKALQSYGETVIGNVPIVPVPGGGIGLKQLDPSNPNGLIGKTKASREKALTESSQKDMANIFPDLYKNEREQRKKQKDDIVQKHMDPIQFENYLERLTKGDKNGDVTVSRQQGNKTREESVGISNIATNEEYLQQMINAQTNINTIHHKTIADEVSEGFMKNITTKQNLETNIAFLKNNKKRDEMYKKLQDDVWEFKEESGTKAKREVTPEGSIVLHKETTS